MITKFYRKLINEKEKTFIAMKSLCPCEIDIYISAYKKEILKERKNIPCKLEVEIKDALTQGEVIREITIKEAKKEEQEIENAKKPRQEEQKKSQEQEQAELDLSCFGIL